MAFDSSCELASRWTGVHESGVPKYTSSHRVTVTSRSDGAQVVADGLIGDKGWTLLVSTYSHGNDANARSRLLRLRPERVNDYTWIVQVEWGDPADTTQESKPDDNGNPTGDPHDWRTEITGFSYAYTRPIRQAFAVEAAANGALNDWQHPNRALGDVRQAILNSAGQMFDPEPTHEYALSGYRYTRYTDQWDEGVHSARIGTVNNAGVIFNTGTGVINQTTWPANTVWFSRFEPSLERINDTDVWVLIYEIITNPFTWLEHIPDRGWFVGAIAGNPKQADPDANWQSSEIAGGRDNIDNARDQNGEPTIEQVKLDGFGKVLGHQLPHRYVSYRFPDATDLTALPIPIYPAP